MLTPITFSYLAVKGETPILAGISVFPESLTVAPAAMVVGILITKTGRYGWAIWSGWVLTTFGAGLLYLLDAHTSTVAWIFLNLVSGIGMGVLFPSTSFAVQASSTNADVAFAVECFLFSEYAVKPLESQLVVVYFRIR